MAVRVGQRLMESRVVARIYAGRLWRRCPLVTAATGLRFSEELALVERASPLADSARALDLACGPGLYTRPLARRVPTGLVVGCDLSRAMLAEALRARGEGPENVAFVRGDAGSLPFRDATFDLVHCSGALHLFRDPGAALAEIARVLAPAGRFTFAVFRRGEGVSDRVAAAFRRRALGVESFRGADLERELRAHGLTGFEILHEHGLWLVARATREAA